jgi:transposase
LEKGYRQQQATDHLGISQIAQGRWVRAERKPSANESATKKSGLTLSDHDELIRLRKENEQLRMEREILNKAAVFSAK